MVCVAGICGAHVCVCCLFVFVVWAFVGCLFGWLLCCVIVRLYFYVVCVGLTDVMGDWLFACSVVCAFGCLCVCPIVCWIVP